LTGKSAEQALLDDFKSQVVAGLQQAVKGVFLGVAPGIGGASTARRLVRDAFWDIRKGAISSTLISLRTQTRIRSRS
jgi:hypothetical protein